MTRNLDVPRHTSQLNVHMNNEEVEISHKEHFASTSFNPSKT